MTRLVLSLPMSGRPDFGFAQADNARDRLTALGYDVASPADMDRARGWVEVLHRDGGDLVRHTDRFDYETAMSACLDEIGASDGIVLLDGWEQSPGCLRELAEARRLGKRVYRLQGDSMWELGHGEIVSRQNVPDWAGLKERLDVMIAETVEENVHTEGSGVNDLHPLTRQFLAVLDEAAQLHLVKSKDYGRDADPFANVRASEHFGVPGWLGAIIRGHDKVIRLQTFATKGTLANEPVTDAMLDLIVYVGMALVMYREQQTN